MDVQPAPEQNREPMWPGRWGPEPERECLAEAGEFIDKAAGAAVSESEHVDFKYLYESLTRGSNDCAAVFQLVFLHSRETAYAVMAGTALKHVRFAEYVTRRCPDEFFFDLVRAALKDTTSGCTRRPIELAETICYRLAYLESWESPDEREARQDSLGNFLNSLDTEELAALLVHCHHDFTKALDAGANGHFMVKQVIESVFEHVDTEALREAFPRLDAHMLSCYMMMAEEGAYEDVYETLRDLTVRCAPFTDNKLPVNQDVEAFVAAHGEDFG